jgi:hypothetical protein
MIVNAIKLTFTENGSPELTLTLEAGKQEAIATVTSLRAILDKGKKLVAEIKQYRQKRSLDANSYAWVLIAKIAEALRTSKEEVYVEMLKRYGQREPKLLSVVADAVDMVYRATQNHCCEVGESELNGKTFKHLAILIGSSQYDSKQMATLIDGIVSECKELDIETLTPQELAALKMDWGQGK